VVLRDAGRGLHDEPIVGHQAWQARIEDGLDIVAEPVARGAHTIGADLDVRREAHHEVVRARPLAHQRLHLEQVLSPAGTEVVGEVVHHAAIGDEAFGLARELKLTSDLRGQHPQLRL